MAGDSGEITVKNLRGLATIQIWVFGVKEMYVLNTTLRLWVWVPHECGLLATRRARDRQKIRRCSLNHGKGVGSPTSGKELRGRLGETSQRRVTPATMNVENDVTSWRHKEHDVNRRKNEGKEERVEGRQQEMASLSPSRQRAANMGSIAVEESWFSAAAQVEEGQEVAFLAGCL